MRQTRISRAGDLTLVVLGVPVFVLATMIVALANDAATNVASNSPHVISPVYAEAIFTVAGIGFVGGVVWGASSALALLGLRTFSEDTSAMRSRWWFAGGLGTAAVMLASFLVSSRHYELMAMLAISGAVATSLCGYVGRRGRDGRSP